MLSVYSASGVDVLSARGEPDPPTGRLPGRQDWGWRATWPGWTSAASASWRSAAASGVSGLGAAVAGADVVVTDNEAPALRVAMMNARRNGLLVRAAAADWRAWPLSRRFHRVIGSDVTYLPSAFDALLTALDASLLPGGQVLLTDPGRGMTAAFRARAEDAGWTWETVNLPPEGPREVFLYRLTR